MYSAERLAAAPFVRLADSQRPAASQRIRGTFCDSRFSFAAHGCVVAENQRVNQIEEREALKKVRIACKRALERIRGAPSEVSARLRRRLDEEIHPRIREPVIDLEVIQSIFEAAASVVDEFPVRGPSLSNLQREVGGDPLFKP